MKFNVCVISQLQVTIANQRRGQKRDRKSAEHSAHFRGRGLEMMEGAEGQKNNKIVRERERERRAESREEGREKGGKE